MTYFVFFTAKGSKKRVKLLNKFLLQCLLTINLKYDFLKLYGIIKLISYM